jgi:hypothetical protein
MRLPGKLQLELIKLDLTGTRATLSVSEVEALHFLGSSSQMKSSITHALEKKSGGI